MSEIYDQIERINSADKVSINEARTTSPISLLPPELLIDIFHYSCTRPPITPPERSGMYQGTDVAVRNSICETCRQWREVALHEPSLWSHIIVGYNRNLKPKPNLPYVKLDLERAGSRLLRLRIWSANLPASWNELFAAVRTASPRIESMCIDGVFHSIWDNFLRGREHHTSPIEFPELKTLMVNCSRGPPVLSESPELWLDLDLTLAPKLRQLSTTHLFKSILLAPGNNLIRLDIFRNQSIDNDIDILQNCPNLRELKWSSSFESFTRGKSARIYLPFLHTLSLFMRPYGSSDYQDLVLQSLTLPLLQKLSLGFNTAPSVNQFWILETLCLLPGDDETFVFVLRNVPSLRELIFQQGYVPNEPVEVIQALVERDDDGGFDLVPLLRGLTIDIQEVTLAEQIVLARNNGHPENPGMPFVLHLHQTKNPSQWI